VPLTTSLYMTLCRAAYFTRTNSFQDALDNPPESCSVNFERDCPEEGCIVSAIANYSSRALQQNITLLEQQNALKFIIHFVGDIHQPLHVENLALGGNKINVTFNGAKTNLHSIWDTAIPQKAEGNFSLPHALAWATNLTQEIKHGKFHKESKSWIKGINADDAIDSAMIWASDSNQYVCTTVLPNGPDAVFGQELSGAYYESAIPVVQHQIAKAGYILAHWLDAIVQADLQHKHDVNHPPKNYMLEKRASYQLEPWMVEARAARRADGGDCGCGEKHAH
jgi:hypothetical protein